MNIIKNSRSRAREHLTMHISFLLLFYLLLHLFFCCWCFCWCCWYHLNYAHKRFYLFRHPLLFLVSDDELLVWNYRVIFGVLWFWISRLVGNFGIFRICGPFKINPNSTKFSWQPSGEKFFMPVIWTPLGRHMDAT